MALAFRSGPRATPNDFGLRGERPTHPELLDWLALRFHRAWLEHQAFAPDDHAFGQLSNVVASRFAKRWHTIRRIDYSPGISRIAWKRKWCGTASARGRNVEHGDVRVFPLLRRWIARSRSAIFANGLPARRRKRTAGRFTFWSGDRSAFLHSGFDLPDNISSCPQRDITTVPNQSLTMLNNRTVQEQAEQFAERLIKECGEHPQQLAETAWKYAYGRNITAEERDHAVGFVRHSWKPQRPTC